MTSLSSPVLKRAVSSMLDSNLESTMETFSLMFLFPFLSSEKLRKGVFYANKYSGNMGEVRTELLVHLLPAVSCLPALRSQMRHIISTLCHAYNFNLAII